MEGYTTCAVISALFLEHTPLKMYRNARTNTTLSPLYLFPRDAFGWQWLA